MLSLVISCTRLKGMMRQFILCALILRETFRYSVVLFALLVVDSFFNFFLRDIQGLFLMPQPDFWAQAIIHG